MLIAKVADHQTARIVAAAATSVKNGMNILTRTRDARKMYRGDAEKKWTDDTSVQSVDLQKAIMLLPMPRMKTAAFTKRIIAFHETFALMGSAKKNESTRKNISVVWHEAIAGRKAEEIVATFVKALKYERDCKSITYWLDSCASQNKNWCLFTVLASLVNS